MKQFIILEWIKLLWNRLSLWAGLCKCSWNKIIAIQWRQLTNMSDLTVLSACLKPISMAAHKYVRSHSVISLFGTDIDGSSQICQISQCYQPVWNRYRWQLINMSDLTVLSACWDPIPKAAHKCQISQCYQPVETRYRRQLANMSDLTVLSACLEPISMAAHKYVRSHSVISLLRPDTEGSSQMSDLTVLSACWDPISKAAHKYVRSHSVISLLRPDIECSSQICQTSQCYQPVETRYRRQLTDMSDLSQCYQPVETRYRRQLTNMSDLTALSACWDPISKAAHKYVRPHSVISLLRPDIEGSSRICQTSQCYQPVETRYRRQLTNMSDLTVLSACWDPISKAAHRCVRPLTVVSACWNPISKAAHKYVRPHTVISLLRPDIEGSSQICVTPWTLGLIALPRESPGGGFDYDRINLFFFMIWFYIKLVCMCEGCLVMCCMIAVINLGFDSFRFMENLLFSRAIDMNRVFPCHHKSIRNSVAGREGGVIWFALR